MAADGTYTCNNKTVIESYMPAEDYFWCMERYLSGGSMNDLISREQLINKLNSTGTNITFDIPVEEILGENVDLDDFATLMQDAIQAYRKMVIGTLRKCL